MVWINPNQFMKVQMPLNGSQLFNVQQHVLNQIKVVQYAAKLALGYIRLLENSTLENNYYYLSGDLPILRGQDPGEDIQWMLTC